MAQEIFYSEESPYQTGYYMIKVHHDKFYLNNTTGSYNIIAARVLNLSYAQYLRFCRDILGATLIGKGALYPAPYFKSGENLNVLLKLLNARANDIIFTKTHPDHEEHASFVKEYKSKFKAVKRDVSHK